MYKKTIVALQKKIRYMEKTNILNKDRNLLKEIFNCDQVEALTRGNTANARRGMTWSDSTIESALQLKFLCGTGGYNLLLDKKIPFPSIRTLNRRIETLKLPPGILDEFFKLLKIKVGAMKELHKICTLSFDEMSIVEGQKFDVGLNTFLGQTTFPDSSCGSGLASKALVFMLGGIAGRWKQMIAYYFTTTSTDPIIMKEIIVELLWKCEEIGLHVINITSDQAGGNQAVWKLFGFGKKPYSFDEFENSIQHPTNPDKKLYLISDAPHAFKNLTQSLLNNKKIFLPPKFVKENGLNSNVVNREDFDLLHEHQKLTPLKIAPRLRDCNINPQGFQKMRVGISKNLMSKEVSAALTFLSDEKVDLRPTAAFVTVVDKWFELVTGRHYFKSMSVKEQSEQIPFLESCIELFSTMKIGQRRHWKPCQTALILTTKSCIDIFRDLTENYNFEFVLGGRLSQDCVENLFSTIRARSPKTTAFSFKAAIKNISVSLYLKTSDGNYQEDDRKYFSFLEQLREQVI